MPPANPRPPVWFFLIFLFMGLVGSVVILNALVLPALRPLLFYEQTGCTVLEKRLGEQKGQDGQEYYAEFRIRYQAGGRQYEQWIPLGRDPSGKGLNREAAEQLLARHDVGATAACWYDPDHPALAKLSREVDNPWMLLFGLIPLVFVVIGLVGAVHSWNAWRAERKAAAERDPSEELPELSPREAGLFPVFGRLVLVMFAGFIPVALLSFGLVFLLDRIGAPFWLVGIGFFSPMLVLFLVIAWVLKRYAGRLGTAGPSPERMAVRQAARPVRVPTQETVMDNDSDPWPTVPIDSVDTSPGATLPYHLPTTTKPLRDLIITLFIAGFWNGIVSVFVFGDAKKGWWMWLFLTPFILIGVGLLLAVAGLFFRFVVSLLVGTIRVEIGEHPLRPGKPFEILVTQRGLARLQDVGVQLKCEESATYRQGTSTSSAKHTAAEPWVVERGTTPFDGRLETEIAVPADAMHSFESDHNKIGWSIRFEGRAFGFLPCGSDHPVVVLPAGAEATP